MNKNVKSIFDFFKKEEEVKVTFSEVQTNLIKCFKQGPFM